MATTAPDSFDLDTVVAVESAMLSTWPALSTVTDGSWIGRLSRGASGRANSITVMRPGDDADLTDRLDWFERIYRDHALPPTLRETPLTPPGLADLVRERGYDPEDPSRILAVRLDDPGLDGLQSGQEPHHVVCDPTPSDRWLSTFFSSNPRYEDKKDVLTAMMTAYTIPVRFICVDDETGRPVSCLVAAVHRRWLTVHNVATVPDRRRRGYARSAMVAAVAFGRAAFADRLWLAVDAANEAALRLYRGLGLTDAYTYRYFRLHAHPAGSGAQP